MSDTLQINANNKTYILNIKLDADATQLKEVVVNSKKRVFETDKGKTIINTDFYSLQAGVIYSLR